MSHSIDRRSPATTSPSSAAENESKGRSGGADSVLFGVWSLSQGARAALTTLTNVIRNIYAPEFLHGANVLGAVGNAAAGFQGISVLTASIEIGTTATAFGAKMKAFWSVRTKGRPSVTDGRDLLQNAVVQDGRPEPAQSTVAAAQKPKKSPAAKYIKQAHKELKYATAREDLIQASIALSRDSVLQSGSGVCNALGFISHFAPAVGFASASSIPVVGSALGIASGGVHAVQGYRTCKVSAISHAASQTVMLHANDRLKDLSTYKDDSVDALADKMDAARRARKPLPDVSDVPTSDAPDAPDAQQNTDPASEQAAAKLAARAAKYDEAVTHGKTEAGGWCMQKMLTVTAALLDLSIANETCNQTKMDEHIRVSKHRIIYGVIAGTLCVLMLLGIVVLGLSGVGAVLLGLVALSQGAGAIWLAYASRRAERAAKAAKDKAANEAAGPEHAVKALQVATGNAGPTDVDVTALTPQKRVAREAVEILADDRPENALARNAFKATLVDLGLHKINFFLMKHVSKLGPGVTMKVVKGLVIFRIENLIAGDGARLRVGKRMEGPPHREAKTVTIAVGEIMTGEVLPPSVALSSNAANVLATA